MDKGAGESLPTTRTPDETLIGLYWAYDGTNQLGTPPRLYNQMLRAIVEANGFTLLPDQWVDLLTLFNVAMGDAAINAWKLKYEFEFWRPVVALRWHPSGATHPNPSWLPLGSPDTDSPGAKPFTPNFPAYPSGHATFGGAAFGILREFLSDKFNYSDVATPKQFTFTSDELNGKNMDSSGNLRPFAPRSFKNIAHVIHENAKSRLFLGVHWLFDSFDPSDDTAITGPANGVYTKDKVGGVPVGLKIAKDIYSNYKSAGALKPSALSPSALPIP